MAAAAAAAASSSSSSSSTKVSVKLLIDTKSNKVLFAEAGKDFIDFLITLLSLPLGTIITLLDKKNMVGSFGNLYESIENLNQTYLQPNLNKQSFLKPKLPAAPNGFGIPHLLLAGDDNGNMAEEAPGKKNMYTCNGSSNHKYVTDDPRAICPACAHKLSIELTYVGSKAEDEAAAKAAAEKEGKGGYVKGVITYMVMDDMVVSPMSTISAITVLNKFNISDVCSLEEKLVHIGIDEGLKLLKEALQSKSVLTSVFLGNKSV